MCNSFHQNMTCVTAFTKTWQLRLMLAFVGLRAQLVPDWQIVTKVKTTISVRKWLKQLHVIRELALFDIQVKSDWTFISCISVISYFTGYFILVLIDYRLVCSTTTNAETVPSNKNVSTSFLMSRSDKPTPCSSLAVSNMSRKSRYFPCFNPSSHAYL